MKQLGILCLCLQVLGISTAAAAQQIVEYSMYDEFGDIMFNAPGRLVKNGSHKSFKMDDGYQSEQDISTYRYRTDNEESTFNRTLNMESDVLTTYKKNQYKTNQTWKFRPLDEEKQKKIIIIEDEPARQHPGNQQYPGNQMYRAPMMRPYMPYSPMAPTMPMSPMMPMAPMMPGLMYPYMPYY